VKIKLPEFLGGVQPRLAVKPRVELLLVNGPRHTERSRRVRMRALSKQDAVRQHGPQAFATRFPPVQVLSIEKRLPAGIGGEAALCEQEDGRNIEKAEREHH
jgi:hypothetical protein